MTTRRARSDHGAAAVEFALVVPLLITLLFGLIWTGFAYADHIAVTNAVREGARYGAAAQVDPTNTSTWATSVRARVRQVYADAESDLTDDQICVRLIDNTNIVRASATGSNCGPVPSDWQPPAGPPAMATGSCAVEVWAQKPRTISLIVFPDLHFYVGGKSFAYYGRTVTGLCPAQP